MGQYVGIDLHRRSTTMVRMAEKRGGARHRTLRQPALRARPGHGCGRARARGGLGIHLWLVLGGRPAPRARRPRAPGPCLGNNWGNLGRFSPHLVWESYWLGVQAGPARSTAGQAPKKWPQAPIVKVELPPVEHGIRLAIALPMTHVENLIHSGNPTLSKTGRIFVQAENGDGNVSERFSKRTGRAPEDRGSIGPDSPRSRVGQAASQAGVIAPNISRQASSPSISMSSRRREAHVARSSLRSIIRSGVSRRSMSRSPFSVYPRDLDVPNDARLS